MTDLDRAVRVARDRRTALGTVLVEMGLLTVIQVRELLAGQEKALLVCTSPACGRRWNVRDHDPRRAYRCKACGSRLATPADLEPSVAYDDEAGQSARVDAVDEAPVRDVLPPDEPYVVVSELGRGGMGSVHLATDVGLEREVALKVAHTEHPALIARFLLEAQVMAGLSHPGILRVHRLGVDAAGRPYYTMKRIEGRPWSEILPGQAPHERLETFQRVLEAMAHAHSRGVIHRDLKPANVLTGGHGEVVVADWGLTKILGDVEDVTASRTDSATPGLTSAGTRGADPEDAPVPRAGVGALDPIQGRACPRAPPVPGKVLTDGAPRIRPAVGPSGCPLPLLGGGQSVLEARLPTISPLAVGSNVVVADAEGRMVAARDMRFPHLDTTGGRLKLGFPDLTAPFHERQVLVPPELLEVRLEGPYAWVTTTSRKLTPAASTRTRIHPRGGDDEPSREQSRAEAIQVAPTRSRRVTRPRPSRIACSGASRAGEIAAGMAQHEASVPSPSIVAGTRSGRVAPDRPGQPDEFAPVSPARVASSVGHRSRIGGMRKAEEPTRPARGNPWTVVRGVAILRRRLGIGGEQAAAGRVSRANSSEQDFWGVIAHFDPAGDPLRLENLRVTAQALRRQGLPLLIVELALGGAPFQVPDEWGERVVRRSSDSVLWHKERLLNLGIERLPASCRKVAWLDGDVLFEDDDWVARASALLDEFVVVQAFETATWLPRDARTAPAGLPRGLGEGLELPGIAATMARSTGRALERRRVLRDYFLHGHTGFAWAARRDLLARHGLYDRDVTGGGDVDFAHAVHGDQDFWDGLNEYSVALSEPLRAHLTAWGRALFADVGGRVAHVPGRILHLWHGDVAARPYAERLDLLRTAGFDPERHVAIDGQGCLRWTEADPEIGRRLRALLAGASTASP